MKKRLPKTIAALLLVACLAGTYLSTVAVAADVEEAADSEQIESRYIGLSEGAVAFDITSAGRADCYGYVSMKDGYTGELTLYLQKRAEGTTTWTNVKTWQLSGTGDLRLDKSYYVTPGYIYRAKTSVNVIDENLCRVEIISKASGEITY